MKSKTLNILVILFILVNIMFFFSGNQNVAVGSGQDIYLYNPYRHVDWESRDMCLSSIHSHTTNSDGKDTPSEQINKYEALGYKFLAITDHDRVTYPWEFFNYVRPQGSEIVAVIGNELSMAVHHTKSLFTDFSNMHSDEFKMLEAASKHDNGKGRFFLAHPGRYVEDLSMLNIQGAKFSLDWYKNLYTQFPALLGMEVFNQNDRYTDDRLIYDIILTQLMPNRPFWMTAADDNHGSHLGYNSVAPMLENPTLEEYKKALEMGEFFAISFGKYNPQLLDTRDGYPGARFNYVPKVESIDVDTSEGTITINASNYHKIEWITANGFKAGEGETFNYLTNPFVDKYVRPVLYYMEGNATISQKLVQPFGIGEFNADSWYFHYDDNKPENPVPPKKEGCKSSASAVGALTVIAVLILLNAIILDKKKEVNDENF